MNWDTRQPKINASSKNYSSDALTVKLIRKFSQKERDKLATRWKDKPQLWPYWVEFEENITHERDIKNIENDVYEKSAVNKKLYVLKNTHYFKEGDSTDVFANENVDGFYYFAHYLNQSIKIPFRKFFYNSAEFNDILTKGLRFYCLSDSSDFSANKDINKIIVEEKKKWDDLTYSGESDLVLDNKKWVDEGVHKNYKTAFANTNLKDNPGEVKKWQEGTGKTSLTASEASTAYQNKWLPSEIKSKLGSTDNQNYSYDVLALDKEKIKEAERKLNEKLAQVNGANAKNRENIIKDLEGLPTAWTSAEEKAVLNNNQQKTTDAINKLKQDQTDNTQTKQQKQNAIQGVKTHWNNNATNGKVNQQTIGEVLGTDWEKEFDELDNQTAINTKAEELKKKIDEAKNKERIQQNQAIAAIENHWKQNQDSNGKINGQTMEQLLGSGWKDGINSLTAQDDITKKQNELTNAINKAKEKEKLETEKNNALTTNPNTNQNWDPLLTDKEKDVINDSSLDSSEAVQAAAKLLSYLRSIRNDKANGGPGKLTDWDSVEKVNKAIQSFQKAHYDDISPYQAIYQLAKETNDQGKAWKVVNDKLNKVAENIYQRYWEIINNNSDREKLDEQNKKLLQENEQSKKILAAVREVSRYFLDQEKNALVDKNEKNKIKILGENWMESFSNKNLEEIEKQKDNLKKLIDEEQKKQEKVLEVNKSQIQMKVDKANRFIKGDIYLESGKGKEADELLKELQVFQLEWALSEVPAIYRAVKEKDKRELGENALNKVIERFKIRIRTEEANRLITEKLKEAPRMEGSDLGNEFRDYEDKLKEMKNEEEINAYENSALLLIDALRPIYSRLNALITNANEVVKNKESSPYWEKCFELIFDLEEYAESKRTGNKIENLMWLAYGKNSREVVNLINKRSGTLLQIVRDKATKRLENRRKLLEGQGIAINENEFKKYREAINNRNTSSLDLQNQRYENEFLEKTLAFIQTPQPPQDQQEQIPQVQQIPKLPK